MFINDNWKPHAIDRPNQFVNYQLYRQVKSSSDKKQPHQLIIFDSPYDLCECVEKNYQSNAWHGSEMAYFKSPESNNVWQFGDYTPNLKSTEESLRNGMAPEQVRQIFEKSIENLFDKRPDLKELSKQAMLQRRRRVFGIDGGDLDIDRVMCGTSEVWARNAKVKNAGRVVRIYFDIGVSAANDADHIINVISMMLAMADIIERGTMQCEIYMGVTNVEKQSTYIDCNGIIVKLKEAGQQIDIEKLLSMTSPAIFRYYMFSCYRNILDKNDCEGFGLGNCIGHTHQDFKDIVNADVYLNAGDKKYDTENKITMAIDELIGNSEILAA